MRNFNTYIKLNIKKYWSSFPAVLLFTTLLAFCACLVFVLMTNMNSNEDNRKKVQIGVVGDMSDSYLGIGFVAIQQLDESRFSMDFIPIEKEETAKEMLKKQEINSYIVIPDGFVDSLVNGSNLPLTYVMRESSASFGSLIMGEIVQTVAQYVNESQSGIYAYQSYSNETKQTENFWENTDELNIKYIDLVINRAHTGKTVLTGLHNGVSIICYFFCGIFTFFLLMWGVSCSSLLSSRDRSLSAVMRSKGIRTFKQVLYEYIAFFLLTALTFFVIFFILGIAAGFTSFGIDEFKTMSTFDFIEVFIKFLPSIGMIAAMQFFLYELVDNVIGSVLLQFCVAIGLAYVSGCFYPDSFFPESIQKIASYLPSGIAFRTLRTAVASSVNVLDFIMAVSYFTLFISCAAFVRSCKLKGR